MDRRSGESVAWRPARRATAPPIGVPPGRRLPLHRRRRRTWVKVPEVTIWFWVAKLATTAMGEATSDFPAHKFGAVVAGAIGAPVFAGAICLQLWVRRSVAWVYWLAVAPVAALGASVADWVGLAHSRGGLGLGSGSFAWLLTFAIVVVVACTGRSGKDRQPSPALAG